MVFIYVSTESTIIHVILKAAPSAA